MIELLFDYTFAIIVRCATRRFSTQDVFQNIANMDIFDFHSDSPSVHFEKAIRGDGYLIQCNAGSYPPPLNVTVFFGNISIAGDIARMYATMEHTNGKISIQSMRFRYDNSYAKAWIAMAFRPCKKL